MACPIPMPLTLQMQKLICNLLGGKELCLGAGEISVPPTLYETLTIEEHYFADVETMQQQLGFLIIIFTCTCMCKQLTVFLSHLAPLHPLFDRPFHTSHTQTHLPVRDLGLWNRYVCMIVHMHVLIHCSSLVPRPPLFLLLFGLRLVFRVLY